MSFHRAQRPVKERGDFAVRQALVKTEMQRELLVGRKLAQRERQVVPQIRRARGRSNGEIRAPGRIEGRMIALTAPGVAPVVVRDAQQLCGKRGAAVKSREAAPGLHERFLREIVGQRGVAAGEMAQELAHGRVVTLHQQPERSAIVGDERASDQFGIGHGRAVRCCARRWRRGEHTAARRHR